MLIETTSTATRAHPPESIARLARQNVWLVVTLSGLVALLLM